MANISLLMNSSINWELKIREEVSKDIKKFPINDQERLIYVIESLSSNPYFGDIQKMKGEKTIWRRRIGAYRIFYEILPGKKVIYIFRVERRTSKTY